MNYDVPKCVICGVEAPDQAYYRKLFGKVLILCPEDFAYLQQVCWNLPKIAGLLSRQGIKALISKR